MIRYLGYLAYHAGLFLYSLLIQIAALWNTKARQFVKGRRGLLNTIAKQTAHDTREKIWFHCASLGEFEQARPLIERLKREHPEYAVVITFFSPSGYEVRKNYSVADYVFYLPLDSQSNAEHFFSSLKIKLAFFVKYEIWYHYLKTLKEFSIPVFLISANIRPDHVYVKWYGTFFKDMLRLFNHIFSQNETSNRLLQEQHFTHISVSKDTRFDRVWENSNQVKQFPFIQQFIQDSKVLIIGSSYAEEETLVEACMECLQDWKIIIAPHHIENRRITEITDCFASHGVTTYSELLNNIPTKDTRVLVIDNVGMLASIYRYGSIAFIGGGYGKSGLHNTLEAAVFGMPVLFGPNNLRKFPESLDMVNAGVGFVINDAEVLKKHLLLWTHYPEQLADIALKARNFVTSQTGATQHIFDYLYAHKLL